ncbi:ROK family protein [Nocardioides sp. cx-169]|uniref:ROK family protein n=1 Tax=Nocardioides sp. cx-169 TaxID=2899080 RepID=UPI001E322FCD|nr:ROK family protein [Nocardioides sp. cx-169]MCD4535744.1 ROK family protein [Nocardioides sp. cx-169]
MGLAIGSDQPASTEGLRRRNTSLVLRSLRRQGPATRAELAKRTGLAKATVGVIVGGLAEVAAVDESDSVPGGRGRPGRPVTLTGEGLLGLGLELNVDYVSAVLLDLGGRVRLSETRPASDAARVPALLDLARDVVRREPAGRIMGAMVAVPGLVRSDDRSVAWTPNLDATGLASTVEAALGGRCPVSVGNDANCAAYAESHHGAATGVAHALYLTGTVGIGAGIVSDGRLQRGSTGFAGEVGHMPIGDSTAVCGCGRRGCWEASVGLHAMLAAVGMPELDNPVLSAAAVAARAADDPAVRRALTRLGEDVGLGLAVLANVLDPEVVVLGGYFVPLGEHVLGPARRSLDERLPSAAQRRPDLRLSTLGIEAAALGAAELALEGVFAGDVPVT